MGKMGVLSVWHFCQNWYLNHWMILTNATAVICCSVLITSDWSFQWWQAENLIGWFKRLIVRVWRIQTALQHFCMKAAVFSLMMQVRRINSPTHRKEKQRKFYRSIHQQNPPFVYMTCWWGTLVSKKLLCWLTGGSQTNGSKALVAGKRAGAHRNIKQMNICYLKQNVYVYSAVDCKHCTICKDWKAGIFSHTNALFKQAA